jgi:hypothetical protein
MEEIQGDGMMESVFTGSDFLFRGSPVRRVHVMVKLTGARHLPGAVGVSTTQTADFRVYRTDHNFQLREIPVALRTA